MPDDRRARNAPTGPPLGGDREIGYRTRPPWWRRQLPAIIVVVAAVLVVGGVTAAVLATRNYGDVSVAEPSLSTSSSAPSPTPTTAAATTPPAAPPPAPTTTAKGTVAAVVAPGRWTVTFAKGVQLTVVTTPATTYSRNKTADDVRKGSTITVTGTNAAGVITATKVEIEKKS